MKRRHRHVPAALLVAATVIALFLLIGRKHGYLLSGPTSSVPTSTEPAVLYFTGDIMLDRGVENVIYKYGEGDFRFPFLEIKDMFADADLLIGNLEGTISDKGSDLGKIYSFRMDPKSIEGLKFAGFDAVSLANNHIDDWGREAIADSKVRLEAAGIAPLGVGRLAEAYAPRIFTVNGIRIAILAFADFEVFAAEEKRIGAALALNERVRDAVRAAKNEAAIVIVFYHYGDEYVAEATPRQRELTDVAFAHGAHLVVGAHPHVVGPLEQINGNYVAYSLGNFVFDQYFSEETMKGAVLRVEIDNDGVSEARLLPITINNRFQPEPAE